jgi:hypothetical protein
MKRVSIHVHIPIANLFRLGYWTPTIQRTPFQNPDFVVNNH